MEQLLRERLDVVQQYLAAYYPDKDVKLDDIITFLKSRPKLVVGCIFLLTGRLYLNYKWNYWTRRGLKGPKPSIMKFGNVDFFNDMIAGKDGFDKYGDTFGLYIATTPFIVVSDASLMREINIKQFSKFSMRQIANGSETVLGKVSKDFLTTIYGAQWKRVRQSTVPLMSQSKITEILPQIVKAVEASCNQYELGKEYDTKTLASQYTIRAILSATFGIDPNDGTAMDTAEFHAGNVVPESLNFTLINLLAMIPEKIRFAFDLSPIPKKTRVYFDDLFDFLFKQCNVKGGVQCIAKQMMSNMITDDKKFDPKVVKGFTKSEIMSNTLLVILAGHETTASVLQFLLMALCNNPKFQEELYQEARSRDITKYEDVRDFKLLDAAIKESMRIWPPNLMNSRYCEETTEVKEGLTIEAGTSVLWSTLRFHMDKNIYDDPEKFDVTRWDGNESNTLQDDAWFGFGQGPRACPGVRLAYYFLKIYVIKMITTYRLEPTENTPAKVKPTVKGFKIVGDKPLLLKLVKRA